MAAIRFPGSRRSLREHPLRWDRRSPKLRNTGRMNSTNSSTVGHAARRRRPGSLAVSLGAARRSATELPATAYAGGVALLEQGGDALPSALPWVAFITWPTKKPVSFPGLVVAGLNCSHSPGWAAMTLVDAAPSASSAIASKPRAAAMAAGSPPRSASRPGPLGLGGGELPRRLQRRSARPARLGVESAPARRRAGCARRGPAPGRGRRRRRWRRAPGRPGRARRRGPRPSAAAARRRPRPGGRGARRAAAAGRRAPRRSRPRRDRAARGRARGSSGSPRPPPSSAWCGCGRRPRPSGGSAGTTRSPASSSSIWRRASYSMARPSERSELRFLISHRVPSSASPAGRTDTLASTRIDPSSIFPSDTPVATRMARSSATYSRASSAVRMSGRATISSSGTPARL